MTAQTDNSVVQINKHNQNNIINKNDIINKNNTVIILDWDNTLFPTTWFMQNNINLKNSGQSISYFNQLDGILYKLLKRIKEYGTLIIVTNASLEWIDTSSAVLPKTRKILQKIKVVSARGNYQAANPNMIEWKKMAFKDEVAKHNINVISVGDANYEYYALISLYNEQNTVLLKSIKFVDDPHHETLIDQLDVMYETIPKISKLTKHLDLKFQMKNEIKMRKKH